MQISENNKIYHTVFKNEEKQNGCKCMVKIYNKKNTINLNATAAEICMGINLHYVNI